MIQQIDLDFCIETMLELMIEEALPEEICTRLINYYNGLKESGKQTIGVQIGI